MDSKKMIVVDLDGTLLNINSCCSRNTKKYLERLKSLGYIIVIATGRVLGDAVRVTDGADFANYVISSSGALIYDMDNKRIIYKNDVPKNEIRRIIEYYNDDIDYFTLCDLYYYNRYGNDVLKMDLFYDKRIDNIDKFIDECDNIFHMIVKFNDNNLVDKYYNLFDNDNVDVLVMQDSFVSKKWLDIYGEGVSKYEAIKRIMEIENIDNSDVISFGDGRNDVDMIRDSGIGVAMGNALDDVKKVSDFITISHNEDGVIYFLKKYIRENNLVG